MISKDVASGLTVGFDMKSVCRYRPEQVRVARYGVEPLVINSRAKLLDLGNRNVQGSVDSAYRDLDIVQCLVHSGVDFDHL